MKLIKLRPCSFFLLLLLAAGNTLCSAQMLVFNHQEYSIQLPKGWSEIPRPEIDAAISRLRQQGGASAKLPDIKYAYKLDTSEYWFKHPYIAVEVRKSGRVSKYELAKLDQVDASSTVRELAEKNKNLPSFVQDGGRMQYDRNTNIVWSENRIQNPNGEPVSWLTWMIPTEEGFIQVHGYCKEKDYQAYATVFRKAIETLAVSPSIKYQERFLDSVPFLHSLNWEKIGSAAIVGAILALISGLFKRKGKKP